MNAFELRKKILATAEGVYMEGLERARNDKDPLTGEKWEGDPFLFRDAFKHACKITEKANDPIPNFIPEDEDGSKVDQLQLIIDMMLSGRIDAYTADNMLKPCLSYLNHKELKAAQGKIDEINKMTRVVIEIEPGKAK